MMLVTVSIPFLVIIMITSCKKEKEEIHELAQLSIYSQTDVDNILIKYPNANHIQGNAFIGGIFSSSEDPIQNLYGLKNITNIDGNLSIWGTGLANLEGLDQLISVGGNFSVTGNKDLISIDGLKNLKSVGGALYIQSNISLISLSDLGNLISIGNDMNISSMALQSFDGLDNIYSIGGDLRVASIDVKSFKGFESLSFIGGNLIIQGNESLISLEGLENLTSLSSGDTLTITNNYALSNCSILPFCEFLNHYGVAIIADNSSGCNSSEEVLENCN